MESLSQIEAITAARVTERVPPGVDTETHHIITAMAQSEGTPKPEIYTAPDKTASEAFRGWLKLLLDALPKS